MKGAGTYRACDAMNSIAFELARIREMLHSYEMALTQSDLSKVPGNMRHDMQGFDLALQLLADVEKIVTFLSIEVPDDVKIEITDLVESLHLERSRNNLQKGFGTEQSATITPKHKSIEIFV